MRRSSCCILRKLVLGLLPMSFNVSTITFMSATILFLSPFLIWFRIFFKYIFLCICGSHNLSWKRLFRILAPLGKDLLIDYIKDLLQSITFIVRYDCLGKRRCDRLVLSFFISCSIHCFNTKQPENILKIQSFYYLNP